MPRPGHLGCHCCDDDPALVPLAFHRNLTTGDVPDAPNEFLDAREELWRCDDGDIAGLTQETVLANCTGTGSAVERSGGIPGGTPGSLRFTLNDITPSADDFAALQIVWTGEDFDAFSHKAHIAAGSLSAYCTARPHHLTEDPVTQSDFGLFAVDHVWGICVRANGLLFVFWDYLYMLGPNWGNDRCWHAEKSTGSGVRVLDGTDVWRGPTTAELRDAGLTVDAIATQQTHDVGLVYGITHTTASAEPSPTTIDSAYDFDTIGIYATYLLRCDVAFTDITGLTLSVPSHTGGSNVEPYETRGISVALSLTTLAAYNSATTSAILEATHDVGYAYTGSTTVTTNAAADDPSGQETATLDFWYTPCHKLVIEITVPSQTYSAWIMIDHSDYYSADDCTGTGDGGTGHATSPTSAGLFYRDIWLPCQTESNGTRLSAQWYGSDCTDRSSETSWAYIHGIRGKCQGTVTGEPVPVCTTGVSPNQLTQITDCYSLDPIAIGYRRRFTDIFGGGSYGPCGSVNAPLDKSYPNDRETHTASVSSGGFTAVSGSSTVDIELPGHGFTQNIPGSSTISINAETKSALTDFINNSGYWPTLSAGFASGPSSTVVWKDVNTLSAGAIANNGSGEVSWPATSAGSGGSAFTFNGSQRWRHQCQLTVLHTFGFNFAADYVIGPQSSQLVAGHLYFDITE